MLPLRLLVKKGSCPPLCLFVELPLDLIRQIAEEAAGDVDISLVPGENFGVTETIAIPSASRLVDVQTAPLPNGVVFKVLSVEDLFQLVKNPTAELLTLASTTPTVAALSVANPGQVWIRLGIGSERWRTQTVWFVNPISGNDENVGSQVSPIQTFREFSRRIGATGEIPATIDITLTSDALATDKLYISSLSIRPDAMIRVHGVPTTLASGTFTAVTDLNSATQTPPSVTDAAQAFGAFTNRRMRIVGGARDGAIAWISLVQAATTVRTSAWGINNVAAVPYNPSVTLVNPQIGDAYVIESLPILTNFDFEASKTAQGTQGSETILFESLKIGNSSNDRFNTGQSNMSISKCSIDLANFYGRDQHVGLCNFVGNSTFHTYLLTLRACLQKGGILNTHSDVTIFIRDQTMAQGVPLPRPTNGGFVEVFSAAAFDSSSDGMIVDLESHLRCTGLLWGNNNAAYGIRCSGRAEYVVKPTITGLTNDTRIGGVDVAYGAIPIGPNANNGAMLCVLPL
jgi:hypothetical protein